MAVALVKWNKFETYLRPMKDRKHCSRTSVAEVGKVD